MVLLPSKVMFELNDPRWWAGGILVGALFLALAMFLHIVKKPSLYLIDFSCVKCEDEHKASLELLQYFLEMGDCFKEADIRFQLKLFLRSGIGEEAYVPRPILEKGRDFTLQDCREQAHALILGAVQELLKKSGVRPVEVDFVIVNSGLFSPIPSLTAFLVNHLKMRTDVKTYNLSGMGCSAGLIGLDLAKDLLRLHRNTSTYAVVVSTEILQHLYDGKERTMMVTNCLFRSAASAILLSNKKSDKSRAKLELLHCLRVNTAASDEAYNCIMVKEDGDGIWGAHLGMNLIDVASRALRVNVEKLATRVLPLGELLNAFWNEVQRKVLKMEVQPYVPDFKLVFDHFCIHPGGRGVIEGIGRSLKLSGQEIEASLMALHRFGNTSSAGVWYILSYLEAKRRLKRGQKVWQIGLGSGFKCNSAVWRVMRDIEPVEGCNPWLDCIHRYPAQDFSKQPHVRSFLRDLENKGRL